MNVNVQTHAATEDESLHALELKVGDAIQLQDINNEQARYYTKLIGYLPDKSVLITHPRLHHDDIEAEFVVGQRILVRGFAERKMFEFITQIESDYQQPFHYLHLSYPKTLDIIHMRGALRMRIGMRCSTRSAHEPLIMAGMIEDISTSGAKVIAKQSLGEIGQEIAVKFLISVDDQEQPYHLSAVIRNTSRIASEDITHGVEFVSMTSKQRSTLQNFICKRFVEGQQKEESPPEPTAPADEQA